MSRLGCTSSKRKSKSSRAGVPFRVGRICRICCKEKWATFSRVGKLASVYLTAVLEYVVAKLVEQTSLVAKFLGSNKRISHQHLRFAVTNEGRHLTFQNSIRKPSKKKNVCIFSTPPGPPPPLKCGNTFLGQKIFLHFYCLP